MKRLRQNGRVAKPVGVMLLSAGMTFLSQAVFAVGETKTPTTAEEIMLAVDDRYEGDSRRMEGVLTLVDKRKNKRVRRFIEIAKEYGDDEKGLSYIVDPPEVRGTSFLSYEWKDRKREDETWLYLPQLRKVKRLASTDKSGYFLGSDFTYWDLTGLEVEDFEYAFVDEPGKQEGVAVIMATPKKTIAERVIAETDYVKVKYWVDKEKQLVLKAQYWLKEGQRVKYYSVSDVQKLSGVWTPKKRQMVMTQGGQLVHASVFELSTITYNLPVQDEEFTTYAMERGIK